MTSKEALEELADEIKYTHNDGKTLTHYDSVRYNAIAKDLKKLDKLERAIKIIVRKDVCPTNLYSAIDYDKYKFAVEFDKIDKEWILTKEEFELLKEVFGNE